MARAVERKKIKGVKYFSEFTKEEKENFEKLFYEFMEVTPEEQALKENKQKKWDEEHPVISEKNKNLLQDFLSVLPIHKLKTHKNPLEHFIWHMSMELVLLNDITPDFVNQYVKMKGLRKFPLKRFKEYLSSLLRFYEIDFNIRDVKNDSEVEYFYSFEDLISTVELVIEVTVAPNLICKGTYDTCVIVICLEWLGLTVDEISRLQAIDVTEDGIVVNGEIIPYCDNELKHLFLTYKKSEGYLFYNNDSIRYREYKDDGLFIKTTRSSTNAICKIRNIIKRIGEELEIDNGLIVESAKLNKIYQSELSGNNSIIEKLSNAQKANYNQYKIKLENYIREQEEYEKQQEEFKKEWEEMNGDTET